MSTFNFQPDDPRLTAYALGELDPNERAEVEAMLAQSSEARTALEEIRETIGLLSRELTFEPALTLTVTQRQAVEKAASSDKGERLGVSPPCSNVENSESKGLENTEGSRPAARRALVSERVNSKSRWGAIVRTATTVATVTVAAGGFLYVSRVFEHEDSSFAKLDSTPVPANQAWHSESSQSQPRQAEMAGLGSDSTARAVNADLSQPAADASTSSKTNAPLSQITMPEPRRRSGDTKDRVEQSGQSSRNEIKTTPTETTGAVPASPAEPTIAVTSEATNPSSTNDPAQKREIYDESKGYLTVEAAPQLRLQASAESREVLMEQLYDRAIAAAEKRRESANGTAVQEPPSSRSRQLTLSAAGGLGAGGFGGQVDSLELHRRDENEGLRTDHFSRFRGLTEEARGAEAYEPIVENAFLTPMEQPLSTFSIDVDTASYANMRRFIQQGQLPPTNAVRIEELVNYFRYDYPEPADGSPFSVNIDVATCPWNPQNKLARVGLKAKTIAEDKRPATNLIFLIDVSGSMAAENKLPLVKQALSVLVSKMGEDDQIAIVTYAGEAGLKLNSTSGSQRAVIQQAIDSLRSGGSTNGAAGINIAYDTAIQSFIKGGANRVILCTDGDFNVGVSDDNTLVEMILEKAASGVFLSVFGFGMGNLKDAKLEKLADKGNGNYGYIDGLGEARKVFGEQLSGTLVTVAKDVKLQLEFNNSTVGAYRLIGYENRVLAAKDFDDDTKDAGEIGAGHTVTALYEIVPKAAWLTQAGLDAEKFDIVEKPTANDETKQAADGRLFTVKLRHKLPDAETSEKSQDYAAMNSDAQLSDSNVDFRFAAAVASFGMQLRESKFRGNWTLQNVLSMADASLSTDRNGERTEFTDLVRGVMRIKGDSVTDPRLTTHETVAPATPAEKLPTELSANDARIKATVDGKYRRLLKKIEVRSDVATYGEFRDFGHWDGTDYSGHSDLPAGYWVWVYPNWYIWGDAAETQDVKQ